MLGLLFSSIILISSAPNLDSNDPYEVLGIDWSPNLEDVQRVFQEVAFAYRPEGPWAEDPEKLTKLQHARDELLESLQSDIIPDFLRDAAPPLNHQSWRTEEGQRLLAFAKRVGSIDSNFNRELAQLNEQRRLSLAAGGLGSFMAVAISTAISTGFNFSKFGLNGPTFSHFWLPFAVGFAVPAGIIGYKAEDYSPKDITIPSIQRDLRSRAKKIGVVAGAAVGAVTGLCLRALAPL